MRTYAHLPCYKDYHWELISSICVFPWLKIARYCPGKSRYCPGNILAILARQENMCNEYQVVHAFELPCKSGIIYMHIY